MGHDVCDVLPQDLCGMMCAIHLLRRNLFERFVSQIPICSFARRVCGVSVRLRVCVEKLEVARFAPGAVAEHHFSIRERMYGVSVRPLVCI